MWVLSSLTNWRGEWDEAATTRAEKRSDRLEAKARQIAADKLGATAYIQGDPRGWPLYLFFPGDLKPGESPDGYYNMRGTAVPPMP